MREEMRSHREVARLAQRQHGVMSRRQLLALGHSGSAIGRMVGAGRLHAVHRGVYAVGHSRLSAHGRCIAAVLACGSGALLSHFAASWLWGLWGAAPGRIDVTVSTRGHSRASIHVHHSSAIADEDRAIQDGIPVTALPRTLIDLAEVAPRRLPRAIERAEQLRLFDLREVDRMLYRCRGHHGRGELAGAIAEYREPVFTRSELERRFFTLVRRAGLPQPSVNTFVAGFELDVFWEAERLCVELDTYEFHGGRLAFERDRVRDEELKLAGIECLRITGRRLDREPDSVIKRLGHLLAARRSTGKRGQ
jgi:very-short-patch-repair endonuclease